MLSRKWYTYSNLGYKVLQNNQQHTTDLQEVGDFRFNEFHVRVLWPSTVYSPWIESEKAKRHELVVYTCQTMQQLLNCGAIQAERGTQRNTFPWTTGKPTKLMTISLRQILYYTRRTF